MATDTRTPLIRTLDELGDNPALDRGVALADNAAGYVFSIDAIAEPLEAAEEAGTPLHPALVHFPIGGAFSAAVLDLLGMRPAAGVVTAFATATAVPTVLAGLHDYTGIDDPKAKRLAFAHLASAFVGTKLVAWSLLARGWGARGGARVLLLSGCAAYGVAGMIGGHLVHGAPEPEPEPDLGDETGPAWTE